MLSGPARSRVAARVPHAPVGARNRRSDVRLGGRTRRGRDATGGRLWGPVHVRHAGLHGQSPRRALGHRVGDDLGSGVPDERATSQAGAARVSVSLTPSLSVAAGRCPSRTEIARASSRHARSYSVPRPCRRRDGRRRRRGRPRVPCNPALARTCTGPAFHGRTSASRPRRVRPPRPYVTSSVAGTDRNVRNSRRNTASRRTG